MQNRLSDSQIQDTCELVSTLINTPISSDQMEEEMGERFITLPCPFEHLHNSPSKPTDARLYLNDYPHLACFHTNSCKDARRELNRLLRIEILGTPR
jgi:hypothetical protein